MQSQSKFNQLAAQHINKQSTLAKQVIKNSAQQRHFKSFQTNNKYSINNMHAVASAKLLFAPCAHQAAQMFTFFKRQKQTPFLNDPHKHYYAAGGIVEVDEYGTKASPFTCGNEKQPTREEKETVVYVCILGWLGANWKHLSKYTDWYARDCNTRCLALIPYMVSNMFDFIANYQARHFVSKMQSNISYLEQDNKQVKTVFHVLSGNGLNMYGHIIELLSQPEYAHLKDRIACTIVDSAPPAITVERFTRGFLGALMAKFSRTITKAKVQIMTRVPHSAETDQKLKEMKEKAISEHEKHLQMKEEQVIAMHQFKSDMEEELTAAKTTFDNNIKKTTVQQKQRHHEFNHDNDHEEMYSHWFFTPVVKAVMHFYMEILGNRVKMEAYRDRVISKLPDKPQLFIYSEGDILIPPEDIHAFIELQRNRRNLNIEELVFKDSAHVAHFKTYPHIYSTHVKEFICESVHSKNKQ